MGIESLRTRRRWGATWLTLTTTLALTGCWGSPEVVPVPMSDREWTPPPAQVAPVTSTDMQGWKNSRRFTPFAAAIVERDKKLAEWQAWYDRNSEN